MFKTIIVPLDGSSLAARAAPYAVQLARAGGGRVILVRAVRESPGPMGMPLSGEFMPQLDYQASEGADLVAAEDELGATARDLIQDGLTVDELLYEYTGHATDGIVDAATARGADLIVMSTHGRGGVGRFIYGSVADDVLRQTNIPVLLIPARCARTWATLPTGKARRILVPLDGSGFAEEALPPAIELARSLDADVVLLQVVEPVMFASLDPMGTMDMDTSGEQAAAREYLAELARRFAGTNCRFTIEVIEGSVAPTIAAVGDGLGVDAIVIASHGRTGLSRAVVGSIGTDLIGRATVPVLVVRPAAVRKHATAARGGARPVTVEKAISLTSHERDLLGSALTEYLFGSRRDEYIAAEVNELLEKLGQREPASVR